MFNRIIKEYIKNKINNLIDQKLSQHNTGGRIERCHVMNYAFEWAAKSDIDGIFMEFGSYEGNSLISAYYSYRFWDEESQKKGWSMRFNSMFVFDSFQGLPELKETDKLDSYGVFETGQYSCDKNKFMKKLQEANLDLEKIQIIEGYYENTLTDETKKILQTDKAIVIHVDCDLYSSAVSVMNFITDFIQDGTIILFDDFYCYRGNPSYGVQRAFNEWVIANNHIQPTPYFNYSWASKAFILNIE